MIKDFNNFLNESTLDSEIFKVKLLDRDVSFYYAPIEAEQYINDIVINIDWKLDMKTSKTGIYSLDAEIVKVYGYYQLVTPTEEDELEQEIEFSTDNDNSWSFESTIDEFSFGSVIEPQEIELDFKNKIIKVIF